MTKTKLFNTSDLIRAVERIEDRVLSRPLIAYYETNFGLLPSGSYRNGRRVDTSKIYTVRDVLYCLVLVRLRRNGVQLSSLKKSLETLYSELVATEDLSGFLFVSPQNGGITQNGKIEVMNRIQSDSVVLFLDIEKMVDQVCGK